MRAKRAASLDIVIPPPESKKRRAKYEKAKPAEWLRFYLADSFTRPFCDDHLEIIADVDRVMREGGQLAIAAYRGMGKTTLIKGLIVRAICMGLIQFPVAIGASARHAEESILDNAKNEFERNDRLAADYPEICAPIRELAGSVQRARAQTYIGEDGERYRTDFQWSGDGVVFPAVEGSKASGIPFRTRGADAAIRGLNFRNRRPDFVLIDDPDTEESAVSEGQTGKRARYIKRGVGQLGGDSRKLGVVMLCTIMAQGCLADQFTDPTKEPAWRGKRLKFLRSLPARDDLWDEYVRMRREHAGDDPEGKKATAFYKKHRKAMDAGAEVANPHAFDKRVQLSAVQAFYDTVADWGIEAAMAELQNDPPDEADDAIESTVNPKMIAGSLNGCARGYLPEWAEVVTLGVDVGKSLLHHVAIAWGKGATGAVIDYGVTDVLQPDVVGVEVAIERALRSLRDSLAGAPYENDKGPVPLSLALVDVGFSDETVFAFCKSNGAPWVGAKGFGQSEGQSPFVAKKPTKKIVPGEYWYRDVWAKKGTVYGFNADYWKSWVHNRFVMSDHDDAGNIVPGTLTLWGDQPGDHESYANHLCRERLETVVNKDGIPKSRWKRLERDQHWFDATVMASVAGSAVGARLHNVVRRPRQKRRVTGGWQR